MIVRVEYDCVWNMIVRVEYDCVCGIWLCVCESLVDLLYLFYLSI